MLGARTTELAVSFVFASALEAASLAAMFFTMGHAGPEGEFALIEWLFTGFNLPGLCGAAIVGVSTDTPAMKLVATIFAFQIPFVWGITYLAFHFLKDRRSPAAGVVLKKF